MDMLSKKLTAGLIPVGLVAGVVAIAIAVLPAVASATEVTPAKTAVTAKLVTGTESTFTTANGSGVTVACKVSETSGETPSTTYNNLKNSTENTSSLAGGSVLANVSTPTFTECSSGAEKTSVATNDTNGSWSLDWNVLNSEARPWTVAAIGVPKAGAVITLEAAGAKCQLTVDPETAQGVVGYWKNGTSTEASKLYINEQVFFAATAATLPVCEAFGIPNADSPAVFRASYTVADSAGEGVIEKWS